jgi:hypothetical protein
MLPLTHGKLSRTFLWGETVMKTRKPTQAKCLRKTSDGIIAKRYLDLQKLRDEVRKAESGCGLQRSPDNHPPKRRQH